tara:strand:+ start:52 stop:609 length:558 start_codon:yes stop_codon:yes gene_type:complete
MKIIGIIPARKGSKRLKHKNVYPINNKPLIEYTIDAALNSKYLNKNNLYINTDFDKVIDIAKSRNVKYIERPSKLAGDKVWTQDVINHTTNTIKNLEEEDIIIILQANSPQMDSQTIDNCIELLLDNNLWQVNTVDNLLINNGAIQVIKHKVRNHYGKANYNGVIITNWIDIHTIEDINEVKKVL